MKKFTAVIAAVAALGMATPSWADPVDDTKTVEILANGEVLASFPPKEPSPHLIVLSQVNLLIRYQGKIYHCEHLRFNDGDLAQVCYE